MCESPYNDIRISVLNKLILFFFQEVASAESMASLCQSQQQCVKASIVSSWQLVEAQDQLCGLELHGSESVEQEHARAIASQSELSQTEQEWRRKESMLGGSRSPVLSADSSQDVFDKVTMETYTHSLKHKIKIQSWMSLTIIKGMQTCHFSAAFAVLISK